MKKSWFFPILLASVATFLLVYSPHYNYPFPYHVDEWHHVTEALELQTGEFARGVSGFRIGFQIIILILSKIADLVADLVLFYKFLPASWAVFSAIVLFYVVYKKTGNQFYVALSAMIFFASIKSNVNITGLWFFTPLTFSIPFIYLYVYFFTEGVEKENKKFILASLIIMVLLLPLHSISVLFAIPFLTLYSLFHFEYFKREWRFFSVFLAIPLIGGIFYKYMAKVPWGSLTKKLFGALQFKHGWGVLEIENSFFELYGLIGYVLAAVGSILIFSYREKLKKYLAYVLWPIMVLISIMIYRKTDVSYLSPYQRNLYYFAISLPMLSALGLDYLFKLTSMSMDKIKLAERIKVISKKVVVIILSVIVVFFAFRYYWYIPDQIDLYEVINDDDYLALLFLKNLPKSTVMATPRISTALYPVSGHRPVATFFFYGNRKDAEKFFQTKSCKAKMKLLDKYNVKYVLSKYPINCGWKLIYKKKGKSYIYEIEGGVSPAPIPLPGKRLRE